MYPFFVRRLFQFGRHFWALFDAEFVFCPVRDHFWADFDAEMRRGGNKITLPVRAG